MQLLGSLVVKQRKNRRIIRSARAIQLALDINQIAYPLLKLRDLFLKCCNSF